MDENKIDKIKKSHTEEDTIPLSIRSDPYFKKLFKSFSKKKNLSQKDLFEAMLINYINKDKEIQREETLSFNSELSLISGNLDNIFKVIKSMANKSQDTISSIENNLKQEIENLSLTNNTLTSKSNSLEERNSLLESANNGFESEKESLIKAIDNIKKEKSSLVENFNKAKDENLKLLSEINSIRDAEKQNLILNNKNNELLSDNLSFQKKLSEKDDIINKHLKKIKELEDIISSDKQIHINEQLDLKNKFNNELELIRSSNAKFIEDLETKLKKESLINSKEAILALQEKYNNLQEKYNNLMSQNIKIQKNKPKKNA